MTHVTNLPLSTFGMPDRKLAQSAGINPFSFAAFPNASESCVLLTGPEWRFLQENRQSCTARLKLSPVSEYYFRGSSTLFWIYFLLQSGEIDIINTMKLVANGDFSGYLILYFVDGKMIWRESNNTNQ